MLRVIKNFKKFRFLIFELVKKDIKLKYRKSYLGILWTLLEPLLTMIVLTVVFSGFYGKSDRSFPIYVLSGRLLYSFFSTGTKAACKSIRSNASIIKKVYVPKYIYPFSSIVANYLIFLISLSVLVVVSLVLGVYPTKYIFAALIPLVTLFFMTIGVGMILATMAVFFRDLEYLWDVMLMLIMYSSAIFYNPAKVIKNGYGWIIQYNPVYACIANFRNAIYGSPIDGWSLWYSVIIALSSVIVGLVVFYKKQDQFILNI
ncbi:MAG: ABC transporter permease [Catonella sp.]|uniref:ABC transporter permease n=1 Tax=Catonella sp. TaxID=2382125 RepID=UPI003FA15126